MSVRRVAFYSFVSLVLLAFAGCGAVLLLDQVKERHFQANLPKIKEGMTGKEVIEILGPPTSKSISDIPGVYWCFGSSTWQSLENPETYCGNILIEMSRDERVVRVVR